jgi:hypothetical protein
MDTGITMIGYPSSKIEPCRIIIFDKTSAQIATVFVDGMIKFNGKQFYKHELDEIIIVRNNFWLFYNSIEKPNS